MQTRQVLSLVTVVAIIALALGVSVGYELSSSKTTTATQIQSFTQISTVTPTVVTISGQTFEVVTATEVPVLVGLYTPTCETVAGHVTAVYSEVPLAESTTITLIFPTAFPPNWQQFIVTVTTNNTNTFSSQIENTTISC